jgi:hypothetical protein
MSIVGLYDLRDPQDAQELIGKFAENPMYTELEPYMDDEVRDANMLVIEEVSFRKFESVLSLDQFVVLVNDLKNTGRLDLPEEKEIQVGRNGQQLTPSQEVWREHELWANDPARGMAEIRQRTKTDPSFRKWFETMRTREGVSTVEGGLLNGLPASAAATVLNAPQAKREMSRSFISVDPQLRAFADEYSRMPVAEIRLRSRRADPRSEEFNNNVRLAGEAGLI